MVDKLKRYEKIEFLGEGQFATVYKAKDVETDAIVAVKKIKIGSRAEAKDGINRTALREIKILQELKHPNIIGLLDFSPVQSVFDQLPYNKGNNCVIYSLPNQPFPVNPTIQSKSPESTYDVKSYFPDVFGHRSNVSLVFDFMDTDLEIIVKDTNIVLTPSNIKAYILMTLQGLEYMHNNWFLHRDLKPNNLLVNSEGILKLGDFGLAKFYGSPNRIYTHQVVTRWYRSPELLFGARIYGVGVDMWAVGCILAELLLRVPFLQGESDLDQLTKIFQVLGTPTEETWPGMKGLPDYIQFKPTVGTPLRDIFTAATNDLLDLLSKLLAMCPAERCTATEALQMEYFRNKPYPTPGNQLPLPTSIRSVKQNERQTLKRKLTDNPEGISAPKRLIF